MSTDTQSLEGKLILLGVCGSIAAYKAAELVRLLRKAGANVQVIMTNDAGRFIPALTLETLSGNAVLSDVFSSEDSGSWTRHIDLGISADLFLIAPATANTLAKLAHGLCDNMLTAVALAARCPVVVSPAMDHDMYLHPATNQNLRILRSYGISVIEPEHGELASGLTGTGRLPAPETLLAVVAKYFGEPTGALSGKTVLVTAGPTQEALDPVRFISNHSSGTMGYELAKSAVRRGARVILVSGPSHLERPQGVEFVPVVSANEMFTAVSERATGVDWFVMSAAVADYTPALRSDTKMPKSDGPLHIEFKRTTDILAHLGKTRRPDQRLVGFALETGDGIEKAKAKLARKGADWIVLNDLQDPGAGFGTGTNKATLLSATGKTTPFSVLPKKELAEQLWETLLTDNQAN